MTFHLSLDALNWAIAHVRKFGDTDIFPRPFEFAAVDFAWDSIRNHLAASDLDLWATRSKRVCLTPKGRYAYRVSTQLDPLDTLVFLGLTYEIGERLEAYRMPSAEAVVMSHRFSPEADGAIYDRSSNWSSFMERCQGLAELPQVTHVVLADISDFFHRIYHHRIENTLDAAGGGSQARVIMKLLQQWSGGVSYGLPVGPSPSRLLADVSLDDVDQFLRAEGAIFCRYSDDYRIFCVSYRDAYDKLSRLADLLCRHHGLTLQQGKTAVVSVDTFQERHLSTPESEELRNLVTKFDDLMTQLGLGGRYEDIDYEDLDPEQQELVDQLNLEGLVRRQLAERDVDIGLMRFLLRRLAQLDDCDVALELLEHAEDCYPVISAAVEYLNGLREVPEEVRRRVGELLMDLLQTSTVGHLAYHRCWLLSPFSQSSQWGQEGRFVQIYNGHADLLTRRKAVLAMGKSLQFYWFRGCRDTALDLEPWERRAFLAGSSCMPQDEKRYWYNSIRARLDPLESAVIDWVRANPF